MWAKLFGRAGYRSAWSGGWHLPDSGSEIRGFECLHGPDVRLSHGTVGDVHVTDMAIDFLHQDHDRPFFLGVSLCNPHDICRWLTEPSGCAAQRSGTTAPAVQLRIRPGRTRIHRPMPAERLLPGGHLHLGLE